MVLRNCPIPKRLRQAIGKSANNGTGISVADIPLVSSWCARISISAYRSLSYKTYRNIDNAWVEWRTTHKVNVRTNCFVSWLRKNYNFVCVTTHLYIFFTCKLKRQRGKTVIYGAVELSSMSSVLCRQRTLCAFLPNSQIIRKILIKSTEGFQQQTEALFMWSLLIFIEIKVNKSRWPRDLTVGMHPLDFWDHGFESRWVHICSYLVFVVCCVGSGLCDELIPHSGNIPRCVCVCLTNCVWTGNLNNEPVLAPVELLRHRKERKSLRLNSSL